MNALFKGLASIFGLMLFAIGFIQMWVVLTDNDPTLIKVAVIGVGFFIGGVIILCTIVIADKLDSIITSNEASASLAREVAIRMRKRE